METPLLTKAMAIFSAGFKNSSRKINRNKYSILEKIEAKKAQSELQKLQQDFVEEQGNFKKKCNEKIIAIENGIIEFKEKILLIKTQNKNELIGMEQKINLLKRKLEDYFDKGNDTWELFKAELIYDVDELEKAFKAFNGQKGCCN